MFEAYEKTADGVGGMLALAPNGLNALQIVDAADVVRSIGQPIPGFIIGDGSGKRYGRFEGLPDLPPSLVMWRSELYRALQDHAIAQGVRIQHGKRLVGITETVSAISVRFSDGTTESADVLIGAAIPRMRPRPARGRAPRWQWRARSSSPVVCAIYPTLRAPSQRTNGSGDPE